MGEMQNKKLIYESERTIYLENCNYQSSQIAIEKANQFTQYIKKTLKLRSREGSWLLMLVRLLLMLRAV